MSSPQNSKLHLKGLNGLRAIAALSVVISHSRLAMEDFGLPKLRSSSLAQYGVTIFFALSGFLITYLLLLEKEKHPVDIKKFYVRRVLRIWPLYYTYLLLCIVTAYFYQPEALPGSLFYYMFLMANIPFILGKSFPHVEHYWSLGVEEQFYLFWPWLVKKSKDPLKLISILTVAYIAFRVFARVVIHKYTTFPYEFTDVTRFDCMAIGAIGAILYYQNNQRFISLCQSLWTQIASWFVILLLAANLYYIPLFAHNVVALITVFIIVSQITQKNRIVNLDKPIFETIGQISFGIYVFHPLIIFYYPRFLNPLQLGVTAQTIMAYGGVVFLTLTVAYLSYRFFETPFLKLKEKFAIILSG